MYGHTFKSERAVGRTDSSKKPMVLRFAQGFLYFLFFVVTEQLVSFFVVVFPIPLKQIVNCFRIHICILVIVIHHHSRFDFPKLLT